MNSLEERIKALRYYAPDDDDDDDDDEGVEQFRQICHLAYKAYCGLDGRVEWLVAWAEEQAAESRRWAESEGRDDYVEGVWG